MTPYNSIYNVPDKYTRRIPTQRQLNNIGINDILLVGISVGLEDTWYSEFFVIRVNSIIEDRYIEGTVPHPMKLTIAHGIKQESKIEIFEDHVYAILTEDEAIELFN